MCLASPAELLLDVKMEDERGSCAAHFQRYSSLDNGESCFIQISKQWLNTIWGFSRCCCLFSASCRLQCVFSVLLIIWYGSMRSAHLVFSIHNCLLLYSWLWASYRTPDWLFELSLPISSEDNSSGSKYKGVSELLQVFLLKGSTQSSKWINKGLRQSQASNACALL